MIAPPINVTFRTLIGGAINDSWALIGGAINDSSNIDRRSDQRQSINDSWVLIGGAINDNRSTTVAQVSALMIRTDSSTNWLIRFWMDSSARSLPSNDSPVAYMNRGTIRQRKSSIKLLASPIADM